MLNEHFGGTYEAYLVLEAEPRAFNIMDAKKEIAKAFSEAIGDEPAIYEAAMGVVEKVSSNAFFPEEFLNSLASEIQTKMDKASDDAYYNWEDALSAIDQVRNRAQIFKRPDVLEYIVKLQKYMVQKEAVGKSNSVADVVKKVYMELFEANPDYFRIPDTVNGVAQSLISYQNSHKPNDLWHLVTPDYAKANIWVQLKSGDNKDMESTLETVEAFFKENPPPLPLIHRWAGLTYINVVWQDKMVMGMLESFLGSFIIVFVMMMILFRSPLWGMLAMVPLSVTIAFIYGIIGIVGKDYDMPVAVLSSLTLGLAVDFAIHFLERSRQTHAHTGSWKTAVKEMFEEPARAISRNVIVIAIGFTPLLLAPLVPYQTVGIFLASIMAISGVATIIILPALIRAGERWLFKIKKQAV